MDQIHTQTQVPLTSGSMVPLTEAPRTKYQKTLVLICYSCQPASGDQKAFDTWVLSGGCRSRRNGLDVCRTFTGYESGNGVQNTQLG